MHRIKLTFVNCVYSIHKEQGVVIARSSFQFRKEVFTTVGIARCNSSIFNEEIGKKLARARAEKKAYAIARMKIKELIKISTEYAEILNNSLDFFNNCIDHQTEYIKAF